MPITFTPFANLGDVPVGLSTWVHTGSLETLYPVPGDLHARIIVWVLRDQLTDSEVPNTCSDPGGAYTLDASINLPDTLTAPDGAPYDGDVPAGGLGLDIFSRFVTATLPAGSLITVAQGRTMQAVWGQGFAETHYLLATNTARTVNRGTLVGRSLNLSRARSGKSDATSFAVGGLALRRDPDDGSDNLNLLELWRTPSDFQWFGAVPSTVKEPLTPGVFPALPTNERMLVMGSLLRSGDDAAEHLGLSGYLTAPPNLFAVCAALAIYRAADDAPPTGRKALGAPVELGRVQRQYESPPAPPGESVELAAVVAAGTPLLLVTLENGTDLQTPTDTAGTLYRPLIFQNGPLLGPFVQLWHGQPPVDLGIGDEIYLMPPRRALLAFACGGVASSGANATVFPLATYFGGGATGVMQVQDWDAASLASVRAGKVYPRGVPGVLALGAVALYRGSNGPARTFTPAAGWSSLATYATDYGGDHLDLWVYWRSAAHETDPVTFSGTFDPPITNAAQALAQWDAVTALLWAGTGGSRKPANVHTSRGHYVVALPREDAALTVKRAASSLPPFETTAQVGPVGANWPCFAEDLRTGRLYLLYENADVGIDQQYSDDDGETWDGETNVFEDARFPCIRSSRKGTIRAGFVETDAGTGQGEIHGVAQERGEGSWGAEFTFVDAAGGPLLFEPLGFDLSFAKDGPERLLLLATVAGDTEESNWQAWDDFGRSWKLIS